MTTASAAKAGTAASELPRCYQPGVPFGVTNLVMPNGGTRVFTVEDQPPPGWMASEISHRGVWDAIQGKVKWGPFPDDAARRLTYTVTPPPTAAGAAEFTGTAWFDGLTVLSISGQRTIGPAPSTITCATVQAIAPGVSFSVTNSVDPSEQVELYSVEEQIPNGWTVGAISHEGLHDKAMNKLKWGPFFDGIPRVLTYVLTPPNDMEATTVLTGVGMFNDQLIPIAGQRVLTRISNLIVRELPDEFLPGIPVTITNTVSPAPDIRVHAIEDGLPTGWSVASISPGGVFDTASRRIKWGPFLDAQARTLWFTAIPSSSLREDAHFSGMGVFDGNIVGIAGEGTLPIRASSVIRSLPTSFLPGVSFAITDRATPASYENSYAVEDQIPPGWLVTNISHSGVFDGRSGKVKWGPFRDHNQRDLRFRVTPPRDADSDVIFAGVALFSGRASPIGGDSTLPLVASGVTRELPDSYDSGIPFTVVNRTFPVSTARIYWVEDMPPEGWVISNISHGGVRDPVTRAVKWGPFYDANRRSLTYRATPSSDATGTQSFAGKAMFDASLVSIEGEHEITRTQNLDPVADGQEVITPEDTSVNVPLTGSSIRSGSLSFALVANVRRGTLSGSLPDVVYTPNPNFSGEDSFMFTVNDGTDVSSAATVHITINPVNDAPRLTDIPDQVLPQGGISPRIPFQISDPDSPAASLLLRADSSNPDLIPTNNIAFAGNGANRTVRLTPLPGRSGTAVITVTVLDPNGSSASDTLQLEVIPPVTVSYTNATPFAMGPLGPASTYPSVIAVAGQTGTLSKVTARLVNLTHTNPDDLDVLLTSPAGAKALLLSDAGGATDVSGVSITIDDSASTRVPDNGQIVSGTFRISNFGTGDVFDSPAPAAPYATTLATFNGSSPNGNWSLYVIDDLSPGSGSVAGWILTLTSQVNTPPTISDIGDQSITQDGSLGALSFTISDAETPASNLVVSVTSSNPDLVPTSNVILGGANSSRTLIVAPTAGGQGEAVLTLTVTDANGGEASDAFVLNVIPLATTGVTNSETVLIPLIGRSSPYPSELSISNIDGSIHSLALTLHGLQHTAPAHLDVLLVGPAGQKVLIMSDAGGSGDLTGVTLTFSDAASNSLPNSAQISQGTYKPANYGTGDTFPTPAPVGPYVTTLSAFRGSDPNGLWNLFIVDDQNSDQGMILGGWSLLLRTVPIQTGSSLASYDIPATETTTGIHLNSGEAEPSSLAAPFLQLHRDREILLSGTHLRLLVRGAPGSDYALERSTDMVSWESWSSGTVSAEGVVSLQVPLTDLPQSFFRALPGAQSPRAPDLRLHELEGPGE